MSKKSDDVLARALAGDPTAYEGDWEVDDSIRFSDREPEVLVSRSLRVSVATYDQVRLIAAARAVSPSALMREWSEDCVAGARPSSQPMWCRSSTGSRSTSTGSRPCSGGRRSV